MYNTRTYLLHVVMMKMMMNKELDDDDELQKEFYFSLFTLLYSSISSGSSFGSRSRRESKPGIVVHDGWRSRHLKSILQKLLDSTVSAFPVLHLSMDFPGGTV